MARKVFREIGQGVLSLAVVLLLVFGFWKGWSNIPWPWVLGPAAAGFLLLATADWLDVRFLNRRIEAADRFLEETEDD